MNTSPSNHDPYFFERRSPQSDSAPDCYVTCIDDRPFVDQELNGQIQIGGGAYGIAADTISASIAASHNHLPTNARSIDVYAKVIGNTLAKEGIAAGLHTECAAELGMPAIIETVATHDPGDLLAVAREIKPDLTETKALRVINAFQLLRDRGLVRPAEEAAACMTHAGEHEPLERFTLSQTEHVSGLIIANHKPGIGFDTKQAYEHGDPAYHLSFGEYPDLLRKTTDIFPVPTELVLTASALRHAAISMHLPKQAGQPFNFQLVG